MKYGKVCRRSRQPLTATTPWGPVKALIWTPLLALLVVGCAGTTPAPEGPVVELPEPQRDLASFAQPPSETLITAGEIASWRFSTLTQTAFWLDQTLWRPNPRTFPTMRESWK